MDPTEGGFDRFRTRRGLLRGVGVAGAVLLAGCTEDVGEELPPNEAWPVSGHLPSLPVEERIALMAERIEAAAAATVEEPEDIPAAVPDGLSVETIERERDVLHLAYRRSDRFATGDLQHVASLAGAYAALVESGDDATEMSIEILDDAPSSYGVATVETTWAEEFVGDELLAEEYAEHVAGTVESKRHSPDVEVSSDE